MLIVLFVSRFVILNFVGIGNIIKFVCSGDRLCIFWKCWVIIIRVLKK